jgi:hypothetical protein
MVGLILGIVVVVLVALALFSTSWVTGNVDTGLGIEMDYNYGLFGVSADIAGESESFSYSDDEMKESAVADNIGTPRIIVIVGLVLAILMIVFGFLAMQGKMAGMLPMIIGLLAGIMLLVGAIMAAGAIKNGIEDDLADSGVGYSFGNGSMFFLTIVAAILAFVGAAMMKGLGKEEEAGMAMPPPDMAAGQPPM